MTHLDALLKADRLFLTDGGLETWLFFCEGFAAPEFAAIVLMDDDDAQRALRRYFEAFLAIAERAGTGFVLDTVTWRGCPEWASKLGVTREGLLRLSRDAVGFAKAVRDEWEARVPAILVNGVVGPAGDAYRPDALPGVDRAFAMHGPQIRVLADAGVDMISAITMSNADEAIGIVRAARSAGLPAIVSFTVETDGLLPTGQPLGEAIRAVDEATGSAPACFMVNCAHPDHFRDALAKDSDWRDRIGGVRANASRLSHAQLDAADELDDGDPQEFGELYVQLAGLLPNLRMVGGCCGTDHRHVRCVSQRLNGPAA